MNPNGNPANLRPFQPGQSGNPAGKPIAARNRISAAFLEALIEDFEEGGADAIRRCRLEDPPAYVRALVALQPKDIEISGQGPFSHLSDDEIDRAIEYVSAAIAAGDSAMSTQPKQAAAKKKKGKRS